MNSFGALLGSAQIQRGVGTSSNGDGAFGGTISLMTAQPQYVPSAELSASFGSYNTLNLGAQFSTGLTGNGVTEIAEGLSAGDQLVVVGQSYLTDGDPVRIVSGED